MVKLFLSLRQQQKKNMMTNLDDLKEQLQEDAMTWHDGLERDRVNSNDMDTLCDIIIKRVNEFKERKTTSNSHV